MKLSILIPCLYILCSQVVDEKSKYFIKVSFNNKESSNAFIYRNSEMTNIQAGEYYDITEIDSIKIQVNELNLVCIEELLKKFYLKGGDSSLINIDFYDSTHRTNLNISPDVNFSYGYRIESNNESWVYY